MTISTLPPPTNLPPAIREPLARLRRQIRRYLWWEGLGQALVWLAVAFWATLAFDWLFEPEVAVRAALVTAILVAWLALVVRRATLRAAVPLANRSLALLVERRYPHLDESLVTAVELFPPPASSDRYHAAMLEYTCRQAAGKLPGVNLQALVNPGPWRRAALAALLGVVSIAALGAVWPEGLRVWSQRMLRFSEELWPRRTLLSVEGFPGGVAKIARGSDLEVIARVDASSRLIPASVQVRYHSEGGGRGRAVMNRLGVAQPGRDAYQEYSHTFRNLLAPVEFELAGGDAAVRQLRIAVVDSPVLRSLQLECTYPGYLQRPPRKVPLAGSVAIPVGTTAVLTAVANKPLVKVAAELAIDENSLPAPLAATLSADSLQIRCPLGRLEKDATILLTLADTDGIRSREPTRVSISATRDEAPRLLVQLKGIGAAVTPHARIPVVGTMTDDYAIARAWFEFGDVQQKASTRPLPLANTSSSEIKVDQTVELEPLGLVPGKKLALQLKAADHSDLPGGPNIGSSERWLFDVVTPEQLRSMMQARELVLRQRFEAILEEVTQTRELIARVEILPPPGSEPTSAAPAAGTPSAAAADEASEGSADTDARRAMRQSIRLERAVQNARKNGPEIVGVAEAFDDIRYQLVNNRLDTEELLQRLQGGIADPLREIAGSQFPELERRLELLRRVAGDKHQGPEAHRAALEQTDLILVRMRAVLDRMLELENFNEAVELLRGIIRSQEKLQQETKKRHGEKLRDLLKDSP